MNYNVVSMSEWLSGSRITQYNDYEHEVNGVSTPKGFTDMTDKKPSLLQEIVLSSNLKFEELKLLFNQINQVSSDIWSHAYEDSDNKWLDTCKFSILHFACTHNAFCAAVCIITKDIKTLEIRDSNFHTPLGTCNVDKLVNFYNELSEQYHAKNVSIENFKITAKAIITEIASRESHSRLIDLVETILELKIFKSSNNKLDLGEALCRAAKSCNLDMIELLLRRGANCDYVDESGKDAVHYAIDSLDEKVLESLLKGNNIPISRDILSYVEQVLPDNTEESKSNTNESGIDLESENSYAEEESKQKAKIINYLQTLAHEKNILLSDTYDNSKISKSSLGSPGKSSANNTKHSKKSKITEITKIKDAIDLDYTYNDKKEQSDYSYPNTDKFLNSSSAPKCLVPGCDDKG